MALTVAFVGMVVLLGLAVTVGISERRGTEKAFRSIAATRRANWEEKRRLQERELDLDEWEQTLRHKQDQLDRLERRILDLERRREAGPEADKPVDHDVCDTEDDSWDDSWDDDRDDRE